MKKLFLASSAYITLDKVLPLLPDQPSKLKLTFVPTASNPSTDKSWLKKDRDKLTEMGFNVKDVDIEGKTPGELSKELSDTDVLFVSGGNTFYLLEKALASGFASLAKEFIHKGKVYIGSSAGSVFVCPTIGFVEGMDDPTIAPSLTSYDGLHEVDFLVMPHYGDEDYTEVYKEILEKWNDKGYELKLLSNSEALIVEGTESKIVAVL
jgi:dipeptidase E